MMHVFVVCGFEKSNFYKVSCHQCQTIWTAKVVSSEERVKIKIGLLGRRGSRFHVPSILFKLTESKFPFSGVLFFSEFLHNQISKTLSELKVTSSFKANIYNIFNKI